MFFINSLLIRGLRIGDVSNLGWLMVVSQYATCGLFVFPIPGAEPCLKYVGFIPTYPVAFFIVMLDQYGYLRMTLFQILPLLLELYS
jgi:hypothetical protein